MRPTSSHMVIGVVGFLSAAPFSGEGAAQSVVPVHEEPRHRLMYEDAHLQVLDIGFEPGDTTLFHRHDRPIAYVEIDATVVNQQVLGGAWGRVSPDAAPPVRPPGRVSRNERYAEAPVDHRVTAVGPGNFRLIGVVHRGDGPGEARSGAFGPFDEVDAATRYFTYLRAEVGSGDAVRWPRVERPVVMVMGSDGRVEVTLGAPEEAATRLTDAGAFLVLPRGSAGHIRNVGATPVVLSFVEVR